MPKAYKLPQLSVGTRAEPASWSRGRAHGERGQGKGRGFGGFCN